MNQEIVLCMQKTPTSQESKKVLEEMINIFLFELKIKIENTSKVGSPHYLTTKPHHTLAWRVNLKFFSMNIPKYMHDCFLRCQLIVMVPLPPYLLTAASSLSCASVWTAATTWNCDLITHLPLISPSLLQHWKTRSSSSYKYRPFTISPSPDCWSGNATLLGNVPCPLY